MTNPELILKMIEMLLAERDKNNELQSKLEEYKKSEGQKCHYIAESGKELQGFPTFNFLNKKKYVHYRYTYEQTNDTILN